MNQSLRAWALPEVRGLFPGVIACGVIAAAATFLSEHYHAPVMLFALLLGIAMNFLGEDSPCATGVAFTARGVLRCGVALLGLRITMGDVASLGWQPVIGVIGSVALTITVSIVTARALGYSSGFGLLSGGATAICGASAALALAASMPHLPNRERATSFVVLCVSVLSTAAMVIYPIVTRSLGLSDTQAGVFLGGAIHDVAQVVGAGYSVSTQTGDTATVVKLLRVALLLPVIALTVALVSRRQPALAQSQRPPLLPWFVTAFAVLVVANSIGWIPHAAVAAGTALSGWCLVAAIAAIGVKTQLKQLMTVGLKPVLLMLGETVFLALVVLGLARLAA